VPVEYEIDLTRLTTQLGTFVDLADGAVLRRQIAEGLRAQLQMESIVTGQLYIELSYRPDRRRPSWRTGGPPGRRSPPRRRSWRPWAPARAAWWPTC
jgi:paraquat-inducible protein B